MLNVLYDHRPLTRLNFTPSLSATELRWLHHLYTIVPVSRTRLVVPSLPSRFVLSFLSFSFFCLATPSFLAIPRYFRVARFCATKDALSNSRLIAGSSGEVKDQGRAKGGWKTWGCSCYRGENAWRVDDDTHSFGLTIIWSRWFVVVLLLLQEDGFRFVDIFIDAGSDG